MGIDKLIRDGSINSFSASEEEIAKALQIAERDMQTAQRIRNNDPDWSYSIGYNAVLQACKAYLFSRGYRASPHESHKATLAFMQETIEEPWHTKAAYLDRVRKKRHLLVYDEIGLVSQVELDNLLTEARVFIDYIKGEIKKK